MKIDSLFPIIVFYFFGVSFILWSCQRSLQKQQVSKDDLEIYEKWKNRVYFFFFLSVVSYIAYYIMDKKAKNNNV